MLTRGRAALVVAAAALGACASGPSAPARAGRGSPFARLATPAVPLTEGAAAAAPARFVPEAARPAASTSHGLDADGRERLLVGALRVLARPGGSFMAAEVRLPETPRSVVELPERLGGGFLFLCGVTLHRADTWLGEPTPIYTSAAPVLAVVTGLDRVYVRTANAHAAIDPRTGDARDLGPFPAAPSVTAYAAVDGWRAAAIADLRGVVVTSDAGASWHEAPVPVDAREIFAGGDEIVVGGYDASRRVAWYALAKDGAAVRLAGAPEGYRGRFGEPPPPAARAASAKAKPFVTAPAEPADGAREPPREPASAFGEHPLVTAVEDGWPLVDGTALVARDGTLARIRLADGEIVEEVHDAFAEATARCHPVALARSDTPAAVGFVCGEPRGRTAIYAYDAATGSLTLRRRFASPRIVVSSGNGALVVRGACAEDDDAPREGTTRLCVIAPSGEGRDVVLGGGTEGARVVALGDGRIAVITPPAAPRGSARLTIQDGARSTTVPILFPRGTPDVARALAYGAWLDGFEERRPGVLGGWLEAGGTMLGVEIALDGRATPGQLVRDAGAPFVAGRFGFGFGGARRGYETTNGGMTWKPIEVPEPFVGATKARAVTPVGAIAAGWVRVGWGDRAATAPRPIPAPRRSPAASLPPRLTLACEPEGPSMPLAPHAAPARRPTPRVLTSPMAAGGAPVLAPREGSAWLPPFYAQPPPALRDGERAESFEVVDGIDRTVRVGALARLYVWGARASDWDAAQAQVRWLSPFAGWQDAAASATTPIPAAFADLVKPMTGWSRGTGSLNGVVQIASGDDPGRALLVVRRPLRNELALFELEASMPPIAVHRADGEPFSDLNGAVRAGGRWIVATTRAGAERGVPGVQTTLWRIEGGTARELATLPRADGANVRVGAGHLARRADGRAVGYVADGQATEARAVALRWVVPVDLETGAVSEPERLGYVDLAGEALDPCAADAPGWVLDAPVAGASVRTRTGAASGSLHGVLARMRLTGSSTCLESLAGTYDGQTPDRARELTRPPVPARRASDGGLRVVATTGQARYPLRCTRLP